MKPEVEYWIEFERDATRGAVALVVALALALVGGAIALLW